MHGGSSLMEWYLGLQGQGLVEDFDGYFTALGGKILDSHGKVSGLGLCGLQEVVFHGRIRGGAARGIGKVEVPGIGEWQCTFCGAAHCWNTRLSCYRCGTHRNWQSGGASPGNLAGVQGRGNGVQSGVVGSSTNGGSGFIGQGGVGNAMGGLLWIGQTGRDQSYVPQGEPTFRRGGGPQGRKNVGVPGAGVGGPRFEEGVQGGGGVAAGPKGVEEPLPPGRVLSQREQALGALDALIQVLGLEAGPQVRGVVEGILPQKPASPVPTTPTHAEVVVRLHELHDSEKKRKKKVEEAQGRLETARAQVLQAEEGMTRADGELHVERLIVLLP